MDFTQVSAVLEAWNELGPYEHMRVYVDEIRNLGMNGQEQRCFHIGRDTAAKFDFDSDMLVITEQIESTRYEDLSTERTGYMRFIPFAGITHIELATRTERISREQRKAELHQMMEGSR